MCIANNRASGLKVPMNGVDIAKKSQSTKRCWIKKLNTKFTKSKQLNANIKKSKHDAKTKKTKRSRYSIIPTSISL